MQPSVSLIRAQSYERQSLRDALSTLLQPLGGMAAFVKPGDRVLLKLNLRITPILSTELHSLNFYSGQDAAQSQR